MARRELGMRMDRQDFLFLVCYCLVRYNLVLLVMVLMPGLDCTLWFAVLDSGWDKTCYSFSWINTYRVGWFFGSGLFCFAWGWWTELSFKEFQTLLTFIHKWYELKENCCRHQVSITAFSEVLLLSLQYKDRGTSKRLSASLKIHI